MRSTWGATVFYDDVQFLPAPEGSEPPFQDGLYGWCPNGDVEWRTDTAYRSSSNAYIGKGGNLNQLVAVEPGSRYLLTFYRQGGGHDPSTGLYIEMLDRSMEKVSSQPNSTSYPPSTTWQRTVQSISVPHDAHFMRIQFFSKSSPAGDGFSLIDNVSLEKQ